MTRLLMYVRERPCFDQERAQLCLKALAVEAVEVNISRDRDTAQSLLDMVGALAVPTFVVANESGQPIASPLPLREGQRKRNTDRGSLISEPTCEGLRAFLARHGFLAAP